MSTPHVQHQRPARAAARDRIRDPARIVTLGIYTFYWVFKTQEEVKVHSGSASAASSAS